jgi:hypothetical protein
MKTKAQARAHSAVHQAVAQGELYKQPCEICGAEPADAHHIDYNDPLRVMWLCTKHHMQTHSQFGRPAPVDWMADIRAAQARIDQERLRLRAAGEPAAHPPAQD